MLPSDHDDEWKLNHLMELTEELGLKFKGYADADGL